MKKTLFILLFFLSLSFLPNSISYATDKPQFIQYGIEYFNEHLKMTKKCELFGWGKGIYLENSKEIKFLWLAITNCYGHFYFLINKEISIKDIEKDIEANVKKHSENAITITRKNINFNTIFGIGNYNQTLINGKRQVLEEKLEIFNTFSYIKDVQISEYL